MADRKSSTGGLKAAEIERLKREAFQRLGIGRRGNVVVANGSPRSSRWPVFQTNGKGGD